MGIAIVINFAWSFFFFVRGVFKGQRMRSYFGLLFVLFGVGTLFFFVCFSGGNLVVMFRRLDVDDSSNVLAEFYGGSIWSSL